MTKKITKTELQNKLGKNITVTKLVKKDSDYWVYFKIKGELGTCNIGGRTLQQLVSSIKRVSKY